MNILKKGFEKQIKNQFKGYFNLKGYKSIVSDRGFIEARNRANNTVRNKVRK